MSREPLRLIAEVDPDGESTDWDIHVDLEPNAEQSAAASCIPPSTDGSRGPPRPALLRLPPAAVLAQTRAPTSLVRPLV
eukprot:6207250-Pyramimonas_sp.AAC.1